MHYPEVHYTVVKVPDSLTTSVSVPGLSTGSLLRRKRLLSNPAWRSIRTAAAKSQEIFKQLSHGLGATSPFIEDRDDLQKERNDNSSGRFVAEVECSLSNNVRRTDQTAVLVGQIEGPDWHRTIGYLVAKEALAFGFRVAGATRSRPALLLPIPVSLERR